MSLRTELEAAGLNVKVVDGWGTRGGAWATGKPVAVMQHHTAAPVPFPVSRLYGDLLKANINTKPDGTVWLIAQKACNFSSGPGSSVVLSEARAGQPPTQNAKERGLPDDMGGNAYYFNFENDHAGDGGPLPQVQFDAIVTATRVVLDHYGLTAGNVISHAEWTARKNDPNWNGSNRAIEAIRQALEDDMPTAEEIALAVWKFPVTRAGVPIPVIQEVADIKTMVTFLRQDAQNLTDAELESAVGNLMNSLPQKVLDLLKSKL
jgi:hypothetical protein